MSIGINQTQLYGFQEFWKGQDRAGVAPSSEARGVDGYRAQQMQDQVALQSREDYLSGLLEMANNIGERFFGGLQQQPAPGPDKLQEGAPGETADATPAAEAPQSAQDAALESLRATGNDNLSYGSSGPEVEALQKMLEAEGYDLGDAGVDGKFGPRTQEAVEAYQRDKAAESSDPDQALKVDGIVGAQTRAALGNDALDRAKEVTEGRVDSALDKHADANAAPPARETRLGSSGETKEPGVCPAPAKESRLGSDGGAKEPAAPASPKSESGGGSGSKSVEV